MKKNLRNILVLAMGLMTTVSFAQDWNVDSRTRIDMGGDNDKMEAAQRATVGATWGGSDWGIHASTVVNYDLNAGNAASLAVYEAYASTDLMGYASVTMGRQALEYGSGSLIGSNEWGADRFTRDAFVFGLDVSMADVTLGYQSRMDDEAMSNGWTGYFLNAAKADGDWSANLLYGSQTKTKADVDDDAMTYMGLDLAYAMMGGSLSLDVSYNTASDGTTDMDMNSIGATYNVNDDMSISATQTSYGENGFNMYGGNTGLHGTYEDEDGNIIGVFDSWVSHGNMGHLRSDQKDLAIGGTYSMGDFNLGVTMHTVTDEGDYERKATEMSLGYAMSANSGLSVNYATDNNGGDTDTKYTWVTLTITP